MTSHRETIVVSVSPFGVATRLVQEGSYEVPWGSDITAVLSRAGLASRPVPLILKIDEARVDPSFQLSGGEDIQVWVLAAGG